MITDMLLHHHASARRCHDGWVLTGSESLERAMWLHLFYAYELYGQ